jgi:hypothetical protein
VLGLHVDGDKLSPKDRADLFAVMQAKLRLYPDIELKNPPEGELTDEMIELECVDLDTSCLSRLGQKYSADQVVHVEVRKKGAQFQMRVRFVDTAQAKVARDKVVRATQVIELAPALELEVEAVFGKPPEPPKKGTLVVEASTPDAVIQLGSDYFGTGNATGELAPGEYTVRVSQAGYSDYIGQVVVRSGETTHKLVTLVLLPPPDAGKKKPPEDDDSDWVVWAVVGAVVVGAAVAVIAVTTGSDDGGARGPAVLGIDQTSAWRDPATVGGRK